MLTFKCLHDAAPQYLKDLLSPYTPFRSLRSSQQNKLQPNVSRLKTVGDRAFQVAAPFLWNNLPSELREINSLELFKTKLKTTLFKSAYGQ